MPRILLLFGRREAWEILTARGITGNQDILSVIDYVLTAPDLKAARKSLWAVLKLRGGRSNLLLTKRLLAATFRLALGTLPTDHILRLLSDSSTSTSSEFRWLNPLRSWEELTVLKPVLVLSIKEVSSEAVWERAFQGAYDAGYVPEFLFWHLLELFQSTSFGLAVLRKWTRAFLRSPMSWNILLNRVSLEIVRNQIRLAKDTAAELGSGNPKAGEQAGTTEDLRKQESGLLRRLARALPCDAAYRSAWGEKEFLRRLEQPCEDLFVWEGLVDTDSRVEHPERFLKLHFPEINMARWRNRVRGDQGSGAVHIFVADVRSWEVRSHVSKRLCGAATWSDYTEGVVISYAPGEGCGRDGAA